MKTSETITKITPAFLKAQVTIESVIKDQTNPFFKSKYADLTSVIDACKEKLNAQGIAILQPISITEMGGQPVVETVLVHESGEWFSSVTPIITSAPNNPQALGSAITYAKRYGLQSMVLLPAEDDDGNSGTNTKPQTAPQKDPTDDWPQSNIVPTGLPAIKGLCPNCKKANMILNPKTNKYFCEDKCWLKGKS